MIIRYFTGKLKKALFICG